MQAWGEEMQPVAILKSCMKPAQEFRADERTSWDKICRRIPDLVGPKTLS